MLKDHNTLTSELEQYITNILTHIQNAFTFNNEHFLQIPIEWTRFIGDIFAIWAHRIDELQHFLTYINEFHPTIKLITHTQLKL